jgi:hypothetical protein
MAIRRCRVKRRHHLDINLCHEESDAVVLFTPQTRKGDSVPLQRIHRNSPHFFWSCGCFSFHCCGRETFQPRKGGTQNWGRGALKLQTAKKGYEEEKKTNRKQNETPPQKGS